MKLTLIAITLFAAAALLTCCKNTKYTADNLPANQIRFGKGGGFTGIEKSWTLLENGQIFEKGPDGTLVALDSAKKKTAKTLFKTVKTLQLDQVQFTYPGNTYSYLDIPAGDKTNRISWGDNTHPVDSKIQELFNNLMALVNTGQ